jgi:hypothetical protein
MVNLRELVESDLEITLTGVWSLPVELTDPDGVVSSHRGQVLYDTVGLDPETGERIVVNNPVVSLRRSDLDRIPVAGERWHVRIPVQPSETAILADFVLDSTRAPEGGASIGFIRLYLMKAVQS